MPQVALPSEILEEQRQQAVVPFNLAPPQLQAEVLVHLAVQRIRGGRDSRALVPLGEMLRREVGGTGVFLEGSL